MDNNSITFSRAFDSYISPQIHVVSINIELNVMSGLLGSALYQPGFEEEDELW